MEIAIYFIFVTAKFTHSYVLTPHFKADSIPQISVYKAPLIILLL